VPVGPRGSSIERLLRRETNGTLTVLHPSVQCRKTRGRSSSSTLAGRGDVVSRKGGGSGVAFCAVDGRRYTNGGRVTPSQVGVGEAAGESRAPAMSEAVDGGTY
jgi:hypothetical protein